MPPELSGAFNIRSATQMLSKLGREISRLHTERDRFDGVTDAAINGAFTAWHMHDWVWLMRFRDDPEARIGIGIDETYLRDAKWKFQKYVTDECSALALCQDVTNGFKHVVAREPKKRQAPAVSKSRVSAGPEMIAGDGFYTFTVTSLFIPEIVDDKENTHRAVDVLRRAHEYWTEFLGAHDSGA